MDGDVTLRQRIAAAGSVVGAYAFAIVLVLLICAGGLGGCTAASRAAGGPSLELAVDRGLYGAEAAYAGAGALLEGLLDAGAVPPERARQLQALERQAWVALQLAREADASGDTAAAKLQAGLVLALVLQMREGR